MSIVTYNGIVLPYASVVHFSQDAVGDDLSDTDWCLTKFDITVQCLINVNYLSLVAPSLMQGGSPATGNPADIMNVIRTKLLQRRKQLSFKFNGVELIPQPQGGQGGTVDARNGPVPKSCKPIQLTNTTFILVYHIVAHYWERNTVDANGNPIVQNQPGNNTLFNRWSESVDIDKQQFSVRTREGKFVIRSDNADGKFADQIRAQMATVGVPPGFLRESSFYKVDPSGLGIEYRVIDKEQYKMPPYPAYHAEGDYTESVPRGGAVRYGLCRVLLRGSKIVAQSDLIRTAVSLVLGKLSARGRVLSASNWQIIESASLRESLYSNEVEFECRMMMGTEPGRISPAATARLRTILNLSVVGLGTTLFPDPPPPSKPASTGKPYNAIAAFNNLDTITPFSTNNVNYQPPYDARGTANRMLRAAAYYDPSLPNTILGPDDQLTAGFPVGTAGKTKEP